MKKLILFAFSMALLLSGCSSDRTGNFQIYLTDQPIDNAEEIWVTISEINVQKAEEGFLTIWEGAEPLKYDLLKLKDKEVLILDTALEEGMYTQIRLVVGSGPIKIIGEDDYHNMTVPSSEVKIPLVFNIIDGGVAEIVLDFEADESIHVVYTGQSEEYILRPVIRVKGISY